MAAKLLREADELAQPVDRQLLELLQRGRGAPEDPDLVEPRDEQLREHARAPSPVVAKYAKKRGLCQCVSPGKQDRVEIGEDARERLGLVRRRRGKRRADLAGLDLRQHRKVADPVEVRRDPVERERAVLAEALAHFLSFAISRQERVLRICSFVSHARRA